MNRTGPVFAARLVTTERLSVASSSTDVWTNAVHGTVNGDNLNPNLEITDAIAPTLTEAHMDAPPVRPTKCRAGERQRLAENKRLRTVEPVADVGRQVEADATAAQLGTEIHRAIISKPNRSGERQRQAENRKRKLELAQAEEEAKRRRVILDESTAMTPAQRIMARIKAKVVEREDAHTRPG
jgi:hypothetical protein